MPCREGPGDPAWRALTNGERAAVFFLAALTSEDSLYQKLYIGTAQAYVNGVYDAFTEVAESELMSL